MKTYSVIFVDNTGQETTLSMGGRDKWASKDTALAKGRQIESWGLTPYWYLRENKE